MKWHKAIAVINLLLAASTSWGQEHGQVNPGLEDSATQEVLEPQTTLPAKPNTEAAAAAPSETLPAYASVEQRQQLEAAMAELKSLSQQLSQTLDQQSAATLVDALRPVLASGDQQSALRNIERVVSTRPELAAAVYEAAISAGMDVEQLAIFIGDILSRKVESENLSAKSTEAQAQANPSPHNTDSSNAATEEKPSAQ